MFNVLVRKIVQTEQNLNDKILTKSETESKLNFKFFYLFDISPLRILRIQ